MVSSILVKTRTCFLAPFCFFFLFRRLKLIISVYSDHLLPEVSHKERNERDNRSYTQTWRRTSCCNNMHAAFFVLSPSSALILNNQTLYISVGTANEKVSGKGSVWRVFLLLRSSASKNDDSKGADSPDGSSFGPYPLSQIARRISLIDKRLVAKLKASKRVKRRSKAVI